MSSALQLQFNAAHDFNRGGPPDTSGRVSRDDVLEYIDAHSITKPPGHPTTAIHWDLIRTFGESDGRRLLLRASRQWDANPLRARDIVFRWWDDDHEPQAWVDEYLADVIRDWKTERDRLRLCADAEKAWLAFNGAATKEQLADWRTKFGAWYLAPERRLGPVTTIIPFPVPSAAPVSSALPLTFFDECQERAPKNWLLKGVIAKGENSSVFGAPGSLKSAMLTDIAVHVSAGKDWRTFKHKERCGVVYFAFERADQVRRRLSAYAQRDGLTGLPIAVASNIVDMLNPACVDIIVATVHAAERRFDCPVGMVIVDTWSKGIAAGGGDEDKARDQNIVAANLRRIHEQLDIHIAGVGHSGKDETRGERGSNARQGDVDLQIHITGDNVKTATVIKANDQPEGILTSFAGEVVQLGVDADGDPITAFILSRAAVAAAPVAGSRLSDRQVLALDALRSAIKEHGDKGAVTVDVWRDEMFRTGVLDRDATNPRQDFKRLRDALARMKRIVEQDGFVRQGYAVLGVPPVPGIPPLPGQSPSP